jgi:ABC-2 type transporter.
MLIAPIFSAIFFLTLMDNGLPQNLPVAVVDMDDSSNSRSMIRQLNAFSSSEVVLTTSDFGLAREAMQQGKVYGILFIPTNFAQEAASGKQPLLSYYANNSYLIAGSLVFKDLKTIATLASASVVLQTGKAKGYTDEQIRAKIQPILLDSHPIGNPWLNYSVYLSNIILPGVLALLVMLVTVYSIGIEIKESTKKDWLASGEQSIIRCLLGKLFPQTFIFLIVGLILFFMLYVWMDFPMNNGISSMLLGLFLLIIASQAFGVFMIGIFPTLRLGLSFACIWGMISFSITGFSFPVSAMYEPIQALSNLFPLRHYFLIYVDQALNGRELFYSWGHYLALLAFCILPFFILSNLKYSLRYSKYQP